MGPQGALLKELFGAAVAAADPVRCLKPFLDTLFERPVTGRIVILGAGKASGAMAKAVEDYLIEALPGRTFEGLVVTRYDHAVPCEKIEIVEAAHPVPDEQGRAAAARILELAGTLGEEDLAVCLISGGGSALLTAPAEGISFEEKQALNGALLKSGATIHEMNCVRKHLSAIKGGRLAAAVAPARLVTLAISDVPGDDLDVIGSGPTVPDPSTLADARAILAKYDIQLPEHVAALLMDAGSETPKAGDPVFERTETHLVAAPQRSLEAAAELAAAKGYGAIILGDAIEGESREVAKMHAAIAAQVARHNQPAKAPLVLLSGGETTVTVRGSGRGGRNAEFLLSLLVTLQERMPDCRHRISAIACDTDGIDGTEDNAGCIMDGKIFDRLENGLDDPKPYLADNDGYGFFEKADGLVMTGPTLTNVNDFRAILIE
ncbi:glycerate kinase [Nisaea sp.]|uniref:glycerate kinase type-2 family protein n=1 Tax=Nisaea sp. TaxID=2024842 RepID=UPI002B26D839|nr:glycerate kinase [Nisaea sp.]